MYITWHGQNCRVHCGPGWLVLRGETGRIRIAGGCLVELADALAAGEGHKNGERTIGELVVCHEGGTAVAFCQGGHRLLLGARVARDIQRHLAHRHGAMMLPDDDADFFRLEKTGEEVVIEPQVRAAITTSGFSPGRRLTRAEALELQHAIVDALGAEVATICTVRGFEIRVGGGSAVLDVKLPYWVPKRVPTIGRAGLARLAGELAALCAEECS